MPRKPRFSPGGLAYHVTNRTWDDSELFQDNDDYRIFEQVLAEAVERHPGIRLCAYCVMSDHFHLVVWPKREGDMSRFMQWVTMTHVARWHARRHKTGRGRLYQSRFKSFPIQQDGHFPEVCRYVEQNAKRAKRARRAESWHWCSAFARDNKKSPLHGLLATWPVQMPKKWLALLNEPLTEEELAALRVSRERGRPYGSAPWVMKTAQRLDIVSSLRPIGRPRKEKEKVKVKVKRRKGA